MCGISGFCNLDDDSQLNIKRMMDRMIHRGPDADGTWTSDDRCVTFGHRRLSIVDLSSNGVQPMTSRSGRYTICFNGEIYNYRKIANKLIEEGAIDSFRGTSDTEVLLEAFEYYGVEEAIRMCKGMFAIALYDKETQDIWLFRDRVGEKPLYYGFVNGAFVFASDIGCIAELEGFNNPIDRKALKIYFIHGYIPQPYSIYEGINKLTPGCILNIKAPYDKNSIEIKSFWSMKETARFGQYDNRFKGSLEDATDELERLLKNAISEQMVADVPVGAFLSSGTDSSTVVSLTQALSEKPVRTFTIGVEDPKYNEAEIAAKIAKHLGTEHTEMYISDADAKAVIPKISHMFGEPFADSSQIPTYLVSKLTRQYVTVSLSGDGGDELFSGYEIYSSATNVWSKLRMIPRTIRKPLSDLAQVVLPDSAGDLKAKIYMAGAKDAIDIYERAMERSPEYFGLVQDARENQEEYIFAHKEYNQGFLGDIRSDLMLVDLLMYHPDDILVKVDRCGMAVSLENRIPLLDKDVIEFAWSLPIEFKYGEGVTKRVLKNLLYRYVPKDLMDIPKRGFSIPIQKWLLEPELREWAENLMDREKIVRQGVLDPSIARGIWEDFTKRGIWRRQVWYLLMFQQWMEEQTK